MLNKMNIINIPFEVNAKLPGANLGGIYLLKYLLYHRNKYTPNYNFESIDSNNNDLIKINKIRETINKEQKVVLLGGDHSTSVYIYKNLLIKKPDLIILFDAHNDYETNFCHTLHNWNIINFFLEDKLDIIVIGYRCFISSAPENDNVKYIYDYDTNLIKPILCEYIKSKKNIYVSIDLDVLNPIEFKAVNYPCPGGLTYTALHNAIKEIINLTQKKCKLVFDIVEFNPLIEKEYSLLILEDLLNKINYYFDIYTLEEAK